MSGSAQSVRFASAISAEGGTVVGVTHMIEAPASDLSISINSYRIDRSGGCSLTASDTSLHNGSKRKEPVGLSRCAGTGVGQGNRAAAVAGITGTPIRERH